MGRLKMSKISFFICYDEGRSLRECIYYIQQLSVPKGYEIEILHVKQVTKLEALHEVAVKKNASAYKVYLDQNTFIVNKFFLYDVLDFFKRKPQTDRIGILGGDTEGATNLGRILLWSDNGLVEADYTTNQRDAEACVLDEVLVVTKCNDKWTQNPIIPWQDSSWCVYDCRSDKGSGLEREYRYQLLRAEFMHNKEAQEMIGRLLKDEQLDLRWQVQRAERQAFAKTIMGYYWEDFYCSQRKWKKYLPANGVISVDRNLNKPMNVVMAFNHGYALYARVMLQSLYKNNKLVKIHVHVLQIDLNQEDIDRLERQARSFGQEISFYTFDKELLPEGLKVTEEWSVEAYFRLFMTDILPEYIDRVLYLDVDVIVNKPIYDFYYMDMKDYEIVGCRDFSLILQEGFQDKRQELFAPILEEEDFVYINSGVMLVDMQMLRAKVCGADYMALAEEKRGKLLAPDQDIINLMHWQNIGLVDEFRYDFFNACLKKVTVDEVRQQVSIIHYAGPKPWMPIDREKHAHRIWWEYAHLLETVEQE